MSTTPPTTSLPSFSSTLRRKAGPIWTVPRVPTEIGVPVLRWGATDGGYLGHDRHTVELVADEPVLDRAQLTEILAITFDCVPEDLADRRGVGGQIGSDSRRQERRGDRELFQDALAGEVVIGVI